MAPPSAPRPTVSVPRRASAKRRIRVQVRSRRHRAGRASVGIRDARGRECREDEDLAVACPNWRHYCVPDDLRRIALDNGIGGHGPQDDGTSADPGTLANCHALTNDACRI